MLEIIESFRDKTLDSLDEHFKAYKRNPFHTLNCVKSRLLSSKRGEAILVSYRKGNIHISSFFSKKSEDIWSCFFQEEAFIVSPYVKAQDLQNFLLEVCDTLQISNIYFPLIYEGSRSFQFFKGLSNLLCLKRLPSPYINMNTENLAFIEHLYNNSSKKINRVWNRFDKNLIYRQVRGLESIAILESIEKKSWKYQSQQSMFHRDNQFEFYKNWLNTEEIYLQAVIDKFTNKSVAFRIDAQLGTKIYTLKYSYDEDYKKFSPGFCLLTKGVYDLWKDQDIQKIDLWGSPDTLKNSIKTGEINRYDFFFPKSSSNQALLDERKAFDLRVSEHIATGGSLKKLT